MKTRPWPIVFLALLNLLSPIYNVLVSAYLSGLSLPVYLRILFAQSSWGDTLIFLLAQPLAGVAIYLTQVWSYPLFIVLTVIAALANYMSWRENAGAINAGLILSSAIVDILLVGYFLLPQVRLVYFNRRIRWWESKPRFILDIPARVVVSVTDKRPAAIRNISEGGAYLEMPGRLSGRRQVSVEYMFMGRAYSIPAKAVHRNRNPKGGGYGLQFVHDADTLEYLQRFSKALELLGCASNRNSPPLKESLVSWITGLAKTGRGWVPDLDSASRARSKPGQR